jgi:hypothetical protein
MEINYLAVVVAAFAAFMIGGLWYSPMLFQAAWMRANRFTDADVKGGGEARIFGWLFVLCLLMSANLAAFLGGPDTTASWGAAAGALTGFGWVAPGIAVVALFERRPLAYMLINGGYWGVALTVMGAIIGVWR